MPFCPWVSCGHIPEDPDLWGFCGGADGMLSGLLTARRTINSGDPWAVHLSSALLAWLE